MTLATEKITVKFTPEQMEVIESLMNELNIANISDFTRECIAAYMVAHDRVLPPTPKRGKRGKRK
jgi:hypothetical protein